jgi:hypothetical protein
VRDLRAIYYLCKQEYHYIISGLPTTSAGGFPWCPRLLAHTWARQHPRLHVSQRHSPQAEWMADGSCCLLLERETSQAVLTPVGNMLNRNRKTTPHCLRSRSHSTSDMWRLCTRSLPFPNLLYNLHRFLYPHALVSSTLIHIYTLL